MHAAPPAPAELDALIRLIDDETPEVRERVAARLANSSGDISEWLASQPHTLNEKDQRLLVEMLSPPRREALAREWIVPSGGAGALREDWDTFESLLRTLSDFLHDGISLRQPLSDALDLLAEEASENGVVTSSELSAFLFDGHRLISHPGGYHDPRNSDLAWCLEEGHSNPLGLCLIYILTARRLSLEVEGVNFPGHFLCRIFEDGFPVIVDCHDQGRLHLQSVLLESPELNRVQRGLLRETADPGAILIRLLNNLHHSLEQAARDEDANLIRDLQATLA